jgi:hypothetical protein
MTGQAPWWFLNFLLCAYLAAGIIAAILAFRDRIVVALMQRFGLHLFPESVGIALLIYKHPEQWTCTKYEMRHPKVGAIWVANKAYGLEITAEFGRWTPNKIERRIIRDAVDWRIKEYVRLRLGQAVNTGLGVPDETS